MRLKIFFFSLVVLMLTTGCPDDVPIDPLINADKHRIEIQQKGGTDTVTMIDDYDSWWISSVYVRRLKNIYQESCQCEVAKIISEERYYYAAKRRGYLLNNVDWHETADSSRLEGDWFKVYIPEDSPNKLVINCDENPEKNDRILLISLYAPELENGYCDIDVIQEKETTDNQ